MEVASEGRPSVAAVASSCPIFLDLYCDAARLAVEADGAMHDPAYDARRDGKLAALGILTLRFTNVEIGAEPEECLRRIREVAERRVSELRGSSDKA